MKSTPTIQKVGPLVFFLAVSVFSLVMVLTGCQNSPTDIDNTVSEETRTSFFDLPYRPDVLAKRPVTIDTVATYELFITVDEGGTLILGEPEVSDALVVLPLSIATDTSLVIEVTKIVLEDGEMPVLYDCSPDGMVFSRPAVLLVNAKEDFGKKCERVTLYWLNEETWLWEFVDEKEVPLDGLVPFEIDHFSKYGAGRSDSDSTSTTFPGPGGGGKANDDID